MVRAVASGALTPTGADPLDWKWWKKVEWTLEDIARRDQVTVTQAQHDYWLGLVGGHVDAAAVPKYLDGAAESLEELGRLLQPWLYDNKPVTSERDDLVAEFRKMFGSPGDPRYEELVAKQRALLEKYRKRQRMAGG